MLKSLKAFLGLLTAIAAQPSTAQPTQPDASTLAQALDRCMATYAVRMTSTDASDDAIFAAATEGCKQIDTELTKTVRRDFPPAEAEAAIKQWSAQAKPNFMNLLSRIRADRAAQATP